MLGKSYTCPMHPEIIQDGPGNCPKCGMALEPKVISLEENDNHELTDMYKRLWISLFFAIPLLFITMGEHIPGITFLFQYISASVLSI